MSKILKHLFTPCCLSQDLVDGPTPMITEAALSGLSGLKKYKHVKLWGKVGEGDTGSYIRSKYIKCMREVLKQ